MRPFSLRPFSPQGICALCLLKGLFRFKEGKKQRSRPSSISKIRDVPSRIFRQRGGITPFHSLWALSRKEVSEKMVIVCGSWGCSTHSPFSLRTRLSLTLVLFSAWLSFGIGGRGWRSLVSSFPTGFSLRENPSHSFPKTFTLVPLFKKRDPTLPIGGESPEGEVPPAEPSPSPLPPPATLDQTFFDPLEFSEELHASPSQKPFVSPPSQPSFDKNASSEKAKFPSSSPPPDGIEPTSSSHSPSASPPRPLPISVVPVAPPTSSSSSSPPEDSNSTSSSGSSGSSVVVPFYSADLPPQSSSPLDSSSVSARGEFPPPPRGVTIDIEEEPSNPSSSPDISPRSRLEGQSQSVVPPLRMQDLSPRSSPTSEEERIPPPLQLEDFDLGRPSESEDRSTSDQEDEPSTPIPVLEGVPLPEKGGEGSIR